MYALSGARIHTASEAGIVEDGTLVVDDGKILDAGAGISVPTECDVYDVTGMQIVPGFVDAHSHAGIETETLEVPDACDLSSPVNPDLMVLDAFSPREEGLKRCLEGGVTTIGMLPGNLMTILDIPEPIAVIAGVGSVIKTRPSAEMPVVLRSIAGIKMALGENPKSTMTKRSKPPSTRMGLMALLRETLDKGGVEKPDWKHRYVAGLLNREYPARVHVHLMRDIVSIIKLAEEYGFDLVLEHVTEGYMNPDIIADNGIPCVVGPILMTRVGPELKNIRVDNAVILSRTGVKVALTCDHPSSPGWYLPMHAGILVREGMGYEEALKAITITPAEIMGVADRVGSLERGKDADFVVFRGDPLEYVSPIQAVACDGEFVVGAVADSVCEDAGGCCGC